MEVCPNCGKERKNLSRHWYLSSSCEYPNLTEKKKEIISGLLMGDGTLAFWNKDRNCRLQVKMTNKEFLDYLDDELGIFSNGVSLLFTGREQAEKSEEAFGVNAREENYNDVFVLQTKSVPEMNEFDSWYSKEGKVWPKNIDLTPLVLKYWYISDGSLDNSAHHKHILISCSSERENKKKVENYFKEKGLPKPSRWNESKRKAGGWRASIAFTKSDTEKLFEYMGNPLPGFEYKWPKTIK
jgi:hypothetical protein